MDHPADPQPRDGPRRSPHPVPIPRPRPGRPVHRVVRRRLGRCGHPGSPHSSPVPTSELLRRTVCPHPASRTVRPHADRQPAPPACSTHRICSPLQRPTTPPRTRPSPTPTDPVGLEYWIVGLTCGFGYLWWV